MAPPELNLSGRGSSMRRLIFRAFLLLAFTPACFITVSDDKAGSDPSGQDGGVDTGIGGTGVGMDAATADMPAAGPCGIAEAEPNDSRDTATPHAAGTELVACLGTLQDVDFYEIAAPSGDPSGGYFQVAITNVGDFAPYAALYAVSDNGEIDSWYADSRGQNLAFYFAAAPGQKYRVKISAFAEVGMAPARYTFAATYTKVDDKHEPNDTRETAKPATVGMALNGYVFAGFRGAKINDADLDDWFQVNLAAGMVTVRLENVPTDTTADLSLYDSTGKRLENTYGSNKGASLTLMVPNLTAGTYHVKVGVFGGHTEAVGRGTMVTDSFTRPYTLTITQ
jgi:hypothetical protein